MDFKTIAIIVVLAVIFAGAMVYSTVGTLRKSKPRKNPDVKEKAAALQVFSDNYDAFDKVARCIEDDPRRYACGVEGIAAPTVAIRISGAGTVSMASPEFLTATLDGRKVPIDSLPAGGQITRILDNLNFKNIVEHDGYIRFTKDSGQFERGFYYNKFDAGEDRIQEVHELPAREVTRIRDEWYYFFIRHSE